jgi:hypothetical protein
MSIELLIMEMSEKGTSAIESTQSINKEMLCPWSNDVDHISEEVLNSLDGQNMQTPFNIGLQRAYISHSSLFPVRAYYCGD